MLMKILVCALILATQAAPHRDNPGYVHVGLINGPYVPSLGVRVGNPPQYVELEVDTGSSDTWLIASDSDFCNQNATNCGFAVAYDKSKSSTYKDLDIPFNATYYSGASNTGTFISEQFGFMYGNTPVGAMKNMTLGWADKVTAYQSFLGLGFDSFESPMYLNDPKWMYPGILSTLYNENIITSRAFGLYMNGIHAANASLTFGGIDYSKLKRGASFTPFNMVSTDPSQLPNQYAVQLESLDLEGEGVDPGTPPIMSGPSIAFVDTGFYVLAVPEANFGTVTSIFNATWSDDAETYTCSCDAGKGKFIKYTFGNISSSEGTVSYSVPANTFVIPLDDGTTGCQALITVYSRVNRLQVGAPFLRHVYTVFNQENYTISFAEAEQYSQAQSRISPIESQKLSQCRRRNHDW